jgi:SynChlorMet cassette radical SAM/SPASM protein ScmF
VCSSDLKDAGTSHVGVSLDGPNEEIHSALRNVAGSFCDALEGIKELKKERLNVQVIISLWKGNRDHIRSTVEMVKSLGVDSVKINPVNRIERANAMEANGEVLSVKETIEFHRDFSAGLEKDGISGVIFDIPPAFQPVKDMRFKRISTCGIFNILGILGDGRISICGIGSSLETLVLGKINKDRIKDIWSYHPVLKEIRENIPAKLEGVCSRCMMKKYCLGKCRAEAYYSEGSLLAPLTFCRTAYEKGLFPESRLI